MIDNCDLYKCICAGCMKSLEFVLSWYSCCYIGSRGRYCLTMANSSLPTPFSSGNQVEWFWRFENCCHTNDWDDKTKAKNLPTLLEGEAIIVWFDLTAEEQNAYSTMKAKIVEQIAPAHFVNLADFHKESLQPGKSLSVFAHELKQLLEQALPAADDNTSKQLLLYQFINGLPTCSRVINNFAHSIAAFKSATLPAARNCLLRQVGAGNVSCSSVISGCSSPRPDYTVD